MKATHTIRIKNTLLIAIVLFATVLSSCKKKEEAAAPAGAYDSGVFIVNEGPFGSGTGTVSHYDRNTKVTTNDIFQLANGYPLGNIAQSMNVINGYSFVVVNSANKIEVVNGADFKSLTTINGLTQPRNILQISNEKAYVTEWGAGGTVGAIKIINLINGDILNTIAFGRKGPEKMLKKGALVYVTCKGGYGYDSVVSVINSNTNLVSTNVEVGPNPDGIVEDANGKLWVLCVGKFKSDFSGLEKYGQLVKLNPTTNTVEATFVLNTSSDVYSQPSGLSINTAKNILYYNYDGKVYSQTTNATSLQSTIFANRSFYSLGVDPATNIIYAGDAGNFSSPGKVVRYNANGTRMDSLNVGIIPGSFYFR